MPVLNHNQTSRNSMAHTLSTLSYGKQGRMARRYVLDFYPVTQELKQWKLPLLAPVNLKLDIDRIIPKISTWSKVWTFPVLGSGRTNSKLLPWEIRISCVFEPEKLPWIAWVIPVAFCKLKLYRNMMDSRNLFHTELLNVTGSWK